MDSPAEIIVVPPNAADRDAVIELLVQQLAEHRLETPRTAIAKAVDGMLSDDRRGFVLVARDLSTVVGVAYVSFVWALEHGGKSAWLEELYVLPDRRERGIGTQLLAAVLEQARQSGCSAVDLEVDRAHGRAANLYSRHGFQPLPRARWVRVL